MLMPPPLSTITKSKLSLQYQILNVSFVSKHLFIFSVENDYEVQFRNKDASFQSATDENDDKKDTFEVLKIAEKR